MTKLSENLNSKNMFASKKPDFFLTGSFAQITVYFLRRNQGKVKAIVLMSFQLNGQRWSETPLSNIFSSDPPIVQCATKPQIGRFFPLPSCNGLPFFPISLSLNNFPSLVVVFGVKLGLVISQEANKIFFIKIVKQTKYNQKVFSLQALKKLKLIFCEQR